MSVLPLVPGAEPFDLRGDRRGVLMLHGFTGTPFEVRPLGDRLATRGLSVLGPLLAGHGTTPAELAQKRWQDWEASASRALDSLRARTDHVCVAGLSMGGLLALRLARLRPSDVTGIVLMAVPLWLPQIVRRATRLLCRLPEWVSLRVPKLGGSDVCDRAARRTNPGYREFPVRAVAQLLELQDVVRVGLSHIQTPTLILHGRHDHTAPPACAGAIAEALGARDVRLRWLERSYHLLPIDVEREEVARHVGDFVEEKLA
jgi:carboxylesterase